MEVQTLVETPNFSQHKIILKSGEGFTEDRPLDVIQTFYVLTGSGTIKATSKSEYVHYASFVKLDPNTPYGVTNTGTVLLTILLTQAR